jgi:GT2 family glycosyltransferase
MIDVEVSVIIVNYNTFEITSNCIKSVIENTSVSYEIILVDNASTENNPDLFKELFPKITLIKSTKNIGFAKGNNLGIAVANGTYILLLNSDTILINEAIDLSVDRIKQNGKIGALSCRLENTDGSPQGASNEFVTIRKNIIRTFRLQKVLPAYQFKKLDLEMEHETDWIWGTFFLFPSCILKYLPQNKLPDDFFMYGEDKQWCYRFKKLGYSIIYYPTAKIQHLIGASSSDKENDRFVKYFLPNEYQMYKLERGRLYAAGLLFSSGILLVASFRPAVIAKGFQYFKIGIKGLLGFI